MKVAFYMHDFAGGGVERMRLILLRALAARGVSMHAIVHHRAGQLACDFPPEAAMTLLDTRRTLSDVLPLARLLRKRRFDIVIANLDHNNIALLLARLLAGRHTRIVIGQHNTLTAEAAMGWKYRLVALFYRLLWRYADAIVAVSDGVACDLSRAAHIPREAIITIYNPVVGQDFSCLRERTPPHAWLADRSIPAFVFVGRFTTQKDPETLLLAMALRLRVAPARLILVGEGHLAESLERLANTLGISHAVLFVGFQADPVPWIAHAHALVLTSRYEGLGNVIIEALACGTPVISTDCPSGPAEILQNGRFGRLVPIGNPEALAAAMSGFPPDRVDAADRCRRAADFTVQACVDKHMALFQNILHRHVPMPFGLAFSNLDPRSCATSVLARMTAKRIHLLVTPNIDHIRLLRQPEFAAAYREASMVCADGFPVALYARLRGIRLACRLTGCDIMHAIATAPELARHRLFLIVETGSTAAAAEAWAARLGILTRTAISVAPQALGESDSEQRRLAQAVAAHETTLLIVTLGAPVSEIFVHRNRGHLPACWALCIGQALRVEVGLVVRSPRIWRALGLEWAWRLCHEPRRLLGRYAMAAAWFPVAVCRDLGVGLRHKKLGSAE